MQGRRALWYKVEVACFTSLFAIPPPFRILVRACFLRLGLFYKPFKLVRTVPHKPSGEFPSKAAMNLPMARAAQTYQVHRLEPEGGVLAFWQAMMNANAFCLPAYRAPVSGLGAKFLRELPPLCVPRGSLSFPLPFHFSNLTLVFELSTEWTRPQPQELVAA